MERGHLGNDLSVGLPVCLSVGRSVGRSFGLVACYLSFYLSACLSVGLSNCLSFGLSVCLSLCLCSHHFFTHICYSPSVFSSSFPSSFSSVLHLSLSLSSLFLLFVCFAILSIVLSLQSFCYIFLKVIGDKQGGNTALALHQLGNLSILEDINQVVQVPIKFIHVHRNPFDNIATMMLRATGSRNAVRKEGATVRRRLCSWLDNVKKEMENVGVLFVLRIGESLFTIFVSLAQAIQFLVELKKKLVLNIEKAQKRLPVRRNLSPTY